MQDVKETHSPRETDRVIHGQVRRMTDGRGSRGSCCVVGTLWGIWLPPLGDGVTLQRCLGHSCMVSWCLKQHSICVAHGTLPQSHPHRADPSQSLKWQLACWQIHSSFLLITPFLFPPCFFPQDCLFFSPCFYFGGTSFLKSLFLCP